MRTDQYVGLTRRAMIWLEENANIETWESTTTWSDERPSEVVHGHSLVFEIIGNIEGVWNDDVAPIKRYTLKDKSKIEEYVQASPWSSGPMYFIGLRPAQPYNERALHATVPYSDLNWFEDEIEGML